MGQRVDVLCSSTDGHRCGDSRLHALLGPMFSGFFRGLCGRADGPRRGISDSSLPHVATAAGLEVGPEDEQRRGAHDQADRCKLVVCRKAVRVEVEVVISS